MIAREEEAAALTTHGRERTPAEFYDDLAPEYDGRFASPKDVAENAVIADVVARYLPRVGRVLDLGCGTGFLCDLRSPEAPLLPVVDPFRVHGVDASIDMLAVARGKHGAAGATFQRIPMQSLAGTDLGESLAARAVVSTFSLSYLMQREALELFCSVVDDNDGVFIAVLYCGPGYARRPSYIGRGELHPRLEAAGFVAALRRTWGVEILEDFGLSATLDALERLGLSSGSLQRVARLERRILRGPLARLGWLRVVVARRGKPPERRPHLFARMGR